jgi:hypothetical protein
VAYTLRQVIAPETDNDDALVASLMETVAVLERVRDDAEVLIAKARDLVAQRRDGRPWDQILSEEDSPRLSALLADTTEAIGGVNSRVRRAQADLLYDEGMAMHRIGSLMGITRQRVAVLLSAAGDGKGRDGGAVEEARQ